VIALDGNSYCVDGVLIPAETVSWDVVGSGMKETELQRDTLATDRCH
jgi:hypothetical protein